MLIGDAGIKWLLINRDYAHRGSVGQKTLAGRIVKSRDGVRYVADIEKCHSNLKVGFPDELHARGTDPLVKLYFPMTYAV